MNYKKKQSYSEQSQNYQNVYLPMQWVYSIERILFVGFDKLC